MSHLELSRRLAGRAFGVFVAAVLLLYPALDGTTELGLGLPSWLSSGYAEALRWIGLFWLSLALGPWERLAPLVEFWPGDDPWNPYGAAGLALGYLGAFALIVTTLAPLSLLLLLTDRASHGFSVLAMAVVAGSFGFWAIGTSRRLQARALKHDKKVAA